MMQSKMREVYSRNTSLSRKRNILLDFDDFGVNTMCLYQFVGEHLLNKNDHIYAYFIHDGLGIAVELHNSIGHSFYDNTFVHRTAMPVIVKGTEVNEKVYYQHDGFTIFAWGNSSKRDGIGGKMRKRRRRRGTPQTYGGRGGRGTGNTGGRIN
eukprot:5625489-Ditylum_brightwellii.AAC.1